MKQPSTGLPALLDAIIVGAGPAGIGASLALAGWRPHYVPRCAVADEQLEQRLRAAGGAAANEGRALAVEELPRLASGVRGRSNNPLALVLDALQHPGVDQGWRAPSCLELRRDTSAATSFLMLDPNPPGGSWHTMHASTRTLSPGPWMEFPGLPLAHQPAFAAAPTPAAAAAAAAARQPRGVIAEYYEAAADHFDVAQHYRPWRVATVAWDPAALAPWTVEVEGPDGSRPPPLRARSLVLATGTAGVASRLGVAGEDHPFVTHRCAALPADARTVLVVGAGLSAADCIVHLLREGCGGAPPRSPPFTTRAARATRSQLPPARPRLFPCTACQRSRARHASAHARRASAHALSVPTAHAHRHHTNCPCAHYGPRTPAYRPFPVVPMARRSYGAQARGVAVSSPAHLLTPPAPLVPAPLVPAPCRLAAAPCCTLSAEWQRSPRLAPSSQRPTRRACTRSTMRWPTLCAAGGRAVRLGVDRRGRGRCSAADTRRWRAHSSARSRATALAQSS